MYRVESYDASEGPLSGSNISYGEFESFTGALFCAIQIIDKFFTKDFCKDKTPEELYKSFRDFGEVPVISGPGDINFNIKEYIHLKLGLRYIRK